ncbi:extracellular solute-binding protein [Streptomyces sp. B6B3]|uniref:extracellular solute-binding protein n=1 Tax=Streptomyces sp. B6B3 TaxID=3153570 RepID=UPI00325C885C
MRSVAALAASDPEWVGRYRLVGRLGAGGMGRVYLARSPGGRSVAVKVIRPELAEDPGFRARFAREVTAARRVNSFFTAGVVDADPEGAEPWLATAYVPGMSLAEAVAEHGPWPPASLAALAAGLGEALEAIHAAEVVHRDLKPPNVLIAADGPRVIDFGISVATESTALTQTGMAVGTPGYMAPEQLSGDHVGPAADVFALGGVLVFAATGEGPFGAGTPHAVNFRAVYEAPRLDGLPASLREMAERCLAKAPDDRPSVTELLEALQPLTAEAPAVGAGSTGSAGTEWLPDSLLRTLQLRGDDRHAAGPPPPAGPPPAAPAPADRIPVDQLPTAGVPAGPAAPAQAPTGSPGTGSAMPGASGFGAPPPVPAAPPPARRRSAWLLATSVVAALAVVIALVVMLNGGDDEPTGGEATGGLVGGGTGGQGEGETNGGGGDGGETLDPGPVAGELTGAGAPSQSAAQELWSAAFLADNPEAMVSYQPFGSGAGRSEFLVEQADFAGTDEYLSDQELAEAGAWCPEVVELPVLLSPVAFAFRLDGVAELSLSPATLARIFDGRITTWNDPAIAAENPGASLPATPITPVHRADPNATNDLVGRYLAAAAPSDWPYQPSLDWPVGSSEGAQGTSGVMAAVGGAQGTIGYAEAELIDQTDGVGVATLRVGGEPVGPTPEAVGRLLEVSERVPGRGPSDFAHDLAWDTSEPGVYPLAQVSYAVACASPEPERADVLRAYLAHIISEEAQQEAASSVGSAPLPAGLSASLRDVVATIG